MADESAPPLVVALISGLVLVLSVVFLFLRNRGKGQVDGADDGAVTAQREGASTEVPTVHIVYGTQTGTAERFSKQLATEAAERFGPGTAFRAVDVEQYAYQEKLASEKLVVFLMATYGDGEPTDTAVDFYDWMKEQGDSDEQPLKGVTYAIFGLGNREYEHFNAAGKTLFKAMKSAGAQPLLELGLGDDDDDIDDDYEKWRALFHSALESSGLVAAGDGQCAAPSAPAEYEAEVLPAGTPEGQPFPTSTGADAHHPFLAEVTTVRELHGTGSGRSCVHVELDVTGMSPAAQYVTGDHVGVYAANGPEVVAAAAQRLGYDLDEILTLKVPAGAEDRLLTPPPARLSIRTLLARFADLLNSPPKASLLAMAEYASNPADAARLKRLASSEGKAEYASWVTGPHRSLLETLDACPSCAPPPAAFFASIAPRLAPRFYSISSSPSASTSDGRVHMSITCAVVEDTTPGGRRHLGVASTYLKHVAVGDAVPAFVRRSHFKLPKDSKTPLVMVGPGTGLAPFRGFIQERAMVDHDMLGSAKLFFGCRHPEHDHIYREEMEGAVASGVISAVHVAYSRLGKEKDYVQHHIRANAAEVWDMLGSESKGVFYVCGDAKHMAKDVHRALCETASERYDCSKSEGEALVKALQDSGRYLRDVW